MAMRRRALDALARCLQARPGPSRLGSHPPLPAAPAAGAARPSSSGRLPPEYERYYGHLPPPTPSKQAVEAGQRLAPPPPPTPGGGQASASTQRETAQAVSAWMFPWERRQLDDPGGGLRPWEKAYWGLFVTSLAVLLATRVFRKDDALPPAEDAAAKEEAKAEAARLLLAGKAYVGDDDDDPFEGLDPKQIQEFSETLAGGGTAADPFDGMSPDEVNAYVAKHGLPGLAR